jgi:hypothetical protein
LEFGGQQTSGLLPNTLFKEERAVRQGIVSVLALAALVLAGAVALAQPPPAVTRISLTKLHCNGCLNTIAAEVNKVPGVAATSET